MDTVEFYIHQYWQNNASDITVVGGGGINNLTSTTHYSYTRIFAVSSTGPISKDADIARTFASAAAKLPSDARLPNYLSVDGKYLIPTDTILSYDSIEVLTKTAFKMKPKEDFTQDQFNSELGKTAFGGASGPIAFQAISDNGHISDRQQGETYINCYDLAHNISFIQKDLTYSTDNDKAQKILPYAPCP
jgi:hypothetical protein